MKNQSFLVKVIYPGSHTVGPMVRYAANSSDLLENIFGEFNAGSGSECEEFLSANNRSLSVNDVVSVDGHYYMCESVGWRLISKNFLNQVERQILAEQKIPASDGEPKSNWFALNLVMERFRRMYQTYNDLNVVENQPKSNSQSEFVFPADSLNEIDVKDWNKTI